MQHDEHCKSCAYRVSDRRFFDTCVSHVFVCLHPGVGRSDCAMARRSDKPCGPEHKLWAQHSARTKLSKHCVQADFGFEPSNAQSKPPAESGSA